LIDREDDGELGKRLIKVHKGLVMLEKSKYLLPHLSGTIGPLVSNLSSNVVRKA